MNTFLELEEKIKDPACADNVEMTQKQLSKLLRFLERDGFTFSGSKLISATHNPPIEELSEAATELNNKALHQQIERMRNALEDDPDLAIGTAKEIVETTCKSILADYGVTADSKWDVIRLVKEARSFLKLIPKDIPESTKGAETIKRLLSNLGQMTQGIAELRKLYGTGHGKDRAYKGLRPRHARLAAGAATTLATFLFETHESQKEKSL